MNAWMKLASCRDPNDVLECQRHYAEKATSDYFEETSKLSRIAMSIATEGLASSPGASGSAAPRTQESRAA
jgi:hypothetical protein